MPRILCVILCICLLCGCWEKSAPSREEASSPAQSVSAPEAKRKKVESTWEYRVSQRTYYRFRTVEPDWTADAAAFPPGFVEAATAAVYAQYPAKSCGLTRGYLYDFDGDGRQEAVLVLFAPIDDMDWFHGDSHFVYVNGDGKAQFLMSGCDIEGHDPPRTVFEYSESKMQSQIIQYPGFCHLLVKSGTTTMAGGSFYTVYIPSGNRMEEGFTDYYPHHQAEDVFFCGTGPQGLGPRYTFWDIERRRYCDVYGQPMPVADFQRLLGQEAFSEALPEYCEEYGFTLNSIKDVMVIGNMYYRVHMSEKGEGDKKIQGQMTLIRNGDGTWERISQGVMDFDVRVQGENYASDVDIAAAQRDAVSTPVGFDAIDVEQIDLASLPTEGYNLADLPSDAQILLWAELPEEDIALYIENQHGGVLLRRGSRLEKFNWSASYDRFPSLEYADYDGDGEKELSVIMNVGHGTYLNVHELHIVQFRQDGRMTDFPMRERLYQEDLQKQLQLTIDPGGDSGRLHLGDQEVSFRFQEPVAKEVSEQLYAPRIGQMMYFSQNGGRLAAEFMVFIGPWPQCPATIKVDIVFSDGEFQLANPVLEPAET